MRVRRFLRELRLCWWFLIDGEDQRRLVHYVTRRDQGGPRE